MADNILSPQTVASLAGKLDEFAEVLTPEEHGVLLGLLGMASATMEQAHSGLDAEALASEKSIVQVPSSGKLPSLPTGLKDAFKAVPGLGNPSGPFSDSVSVGATCVTWSKDYNKDFPGGGGAAMRIRGLKQTR